MYKGKKVILTTTACKRINLLKAAIQSFGIFCQDKNIIDEIHYYDDSSQSHERSTAIEYYHAKGTSRSYDRNIESWRECLEYFNIEQWKKCHAEIITGKHDVSGALYVEKFEFLDKVLTNYYSGNFWWASAKYINTLDNLSAKMLEVNMERAEAERWLGRKPHRWASLYNENVSDWYMHYFDPKLYKQP